MTTVADQLRAALGMDAADAALKEMPSIYTHLAAGKSGGKSVRVFNTSAPGGGSESLRWLGPSEFAASQMVEAQRRHDEEERNWCPYRSGAQR